MYEVEVTLVYIRYIGKQITLREDVVLIGIAGAFPDFTCWSFDGRV
jgi:hypothetical protein